MTTLRRPGRLALVGGIALSVGLAGIAAAWAQASVPRSVTAQIGIRYSRYERSRLTVPAGVPITIVLRKRRPDRSRVDRR